MRFLAELSYPDQLRAFFAMAGIWVGAVCLGMAPSTHGQDEKP